MHATLIWRRAKRAFMTQPLALLLALSASGIRVAAPPVAVVVEVAGAWSAGPGGVDLVVGAELPAEARVATSAGDAASRIVIVAFDGRRYECSARAACRTVTVAKPVAEEGVFARIGESLRSLVRTEKGRAVFTMSRGDLRVEPALVQRDAAGLDLSDALVAANGALEVALAFDADSEPLFEAKLAANAKRVLPAPRGFDGHAWLLTVRNEEGGTASAWVMIPSPDQAAQLRDELANLRRKTSTWKDVAAERRVVSAFLLRKHP